ncbi:hypothetical protein TAMA11512_23830 [Selenomonas sp. TAMA-11512]|uniref:hypothetical protein n=1 Tax=Selenomonas sp. TAMA-11512 TaxID=3095337 RepID=UPI0030919DF1|nr:hypothetical protein TAMA11512_23830 [Selenomonas sp. TAMA-11512]
MKKLILMVTLIVTAAVLIPTGACEAKDVWVAHWNAEDVDIYVMDDTIASGASDTVKHFKVSTKEVRNGELIRRIDWTFSKYKTDMWRYETSAMKGTHTTVVIPRDEIFEFCMNALGWSYRIKDFWYY